MTAWTRLLRAARDCGPAALMVLALLASVAGGASVPHAHVTGDVGLFNHDHDLSLLAALGGPGPVPASPGDLAIALIPLGLVALPAPRLTRRARGRAASRAPPRSA